MEKVKESEARIIVYLSVVPAEKKNLVNISHRLGMDYGYCIRILGDMTMKGWLVKHKHGRFMAYNLTPTAPMESAKAWYNADELQRRLLIDEQ